MRSLRKIGWVATLIPFLIACEAYEAPPIIPQTGSAVISPENGGNLVLAVENAEATIPFEVTIADFAKDGNVTYAVEMDMAGAGFANAVEIGTSETTTVDVLTSDLNDELVAKGLPLGTPSDVEFRVKASTDAGFSPLYGATTTVSVTPYDAFVDFPVLYVPGDYQGWNPANEKTVLKSVNFDKTFTGFVHILSGSGEFKFTEENNWVDDKNWGDNGADGTLDNPSDAANIKVEEFGTFEVTVDMGAKTYTMSDPLLWGIIGDATPGGWDAETPMNFDRDENVLTITADLNAGEMKFRANQNWDYNYGGADGELTAGGDNIPVAEAGNYTITLNFTEPGEVTYTLTKN
ncbi:SusF/SusE family outer membrane protein [Algoriphagus sediminis]|uniref:SusF/SusE family outer membrane protein n=1 Tax=Algoriphagus sediminis TaxID=3057113 RepID=A0ABT7YA21_9BACT|nr:SusF/SusE family outer membrane protein [Algoriphagus sediminis]MDN3203367.1 SusF/SusE family outer membrane protein [Algoriphagus sediminis]